MLLTGVGYCLTDDILCIEHCNCRFSVVRIFERERRFFSFLRIFLVRIVGKVFFCHVIEIVYKCKTFCAEFKNSSENNNEFHFGLH